MIPIAIRTSVWLGVIVLALGLWVADAAPGQAAGGALVGQEACLECHDDLAEPFLDSAHGRSDIQGWDGAAGCESCHGPGEEHMDSGGEVALTGTDQGASCLSCHEGDAAAHWESSLHADFDVTCSDCHDVHLSWQADAALEDKSTEFAALVAKNTSETCLSCHQNQRKHLYQRSRHPLKEGLMSCISCHDPHGSPAQNAINALTPNDKCYECHADKRGPFLFEHQPVREDCKTCHDPHGSNHASMLASAPPRLCQSCHLFGHHQTVPGTDGQVWNVNRGCVNCHPRIHGSNHPSGVIFMR